MELQVKRIPNLSSLPIFVVEVTLMKLSDEFFKFLFRVLKIYAVLVNFILHRKIVRKEYSWIVETFHFAWATYLPATPAPATYSKHYLKRLNISEWKKINKNVTQYHAAEIVNFGGKLSRFFKADTQMTLRQRFMNMIISGVFPFADFQYSIQ